MRVWRDDSGGAVVNVLFITLDFPWPPERGGRVRTLSQLRVLSSIPEVERIRLFSLSEDPVYPAHLDALAHEVAKVEVLEPVFHPIHLFRHPRFIPRVVWLRAVRGVPYLAGKWDSPAVYRALERELLEESFDIVWLDSLGTARYLPLIRGLQPLARVVLDEHNVVSDIWAQFARRQAPLKRLVARAEWAAARRFERDALRAVDAVGAISADDARAYREFADVEAHTVPPVVSFVRRTSQPCREPRVCYVGDLNWRPNARGLDWFFAEVWPRVRDRLPGATLEIAGPGLPLDTRGGALLPPQWRAPGVTALGFVPDLSLLYERSAALVAPIFDGSGVRMKVLDAFRYGVPVVTTPDGAAGLTIEPGREAFVESNPEMFAARVTQLATSGEDQMRLRAAGYDFLERHHGLAQAQITMRALLGLDAGVPSLVDRPPVDLTTPRRSRVLIVFGTRPEAIKLAPVVRAFQTRAPEIEVRVCITGQHREMLQPVLDLFDIAPDYDLHLMTPNQKLAGLTSSVLGETAKVLEAFRPDWVVVQGDTTTAFAAALAAFFHGARIAHIEAGLRTSEKRRPFPEEANRRMVDLLADLHFAPTQSARQNLLREAVDPRVVHVTGNTVVDALYHIIAMDYDLGSGPLASIPFDRRIILVTAHRRENFGPGVIAICRALRDLAEHDADIHVVYPVHLNPNVRDPVHERLGGHPRISLIPPLDYASFVHLMRRATLILTDSGGIQEEAPTLGKPVLIMRNATERPEAVEAGCARVVGTDPARIVQEARRLLDDGDAYRRMARIANPFGDGRASARIVDVLRMASRADSDRTSAPWARLPDVATGYRAV